MSAHIFQDLDERINGRRCAASCVNIRLQMFVIMIASQRKISVSLLEREKTCLSHIPQNVIQAK